MKICRNTGSTALAELPICELFVGTSRHPRTCLSCPLDRRGEDLFAAPAGFRIPGKENHAHAVAADFRKSDAQFAGFDPQRNLSGTCIVMPAPSPVLTSHPTAPRC